MTEKSTNLDNKKFVKNEWSNRVKKTKSSGYIYVYYKKHPTADKEGWIGEHRLIMENHIGRYLETHEHVHHINNDRSDNRIENLELHTSSTHLLEHHRQRRIERDKRVCSNCGSNKTTLGSKTHRGYRYYYPRWHKNKEDKNKWLCQLCYQRSYRSDRSESFPLSFFERPFV